MIDHPAEVFTDGQVGGLRPRRSSPPAVAASSGAFDSGQGRLHTGLLKVLGVFWLRPGLRPCRKKSSRQRSMPTGKAGCVLQAWPLLPNPGRDTMMGEGGDAVPVEACLGFDPC